MAVVLKFPLHTFFKNVYEAIRKKQNDIERRKTDFLFKEAYRNFLEQYLAGVKRFKVVDFPAFMYLSGRVVCQEALNQATEVMLTVIKDGKIDQCYTARIKELKKQAKVKRGF